MALNLTENALNASLQNSKELNIVFEIEDVATLFGAVPIRKFVRIGDPDLEIGDPDTNSNAFFIGGFNLVDNQKDFISFDAPGGGTSTTIRQQLQIDRGKSGSVTNFKVVLIDQDEFVTELVTPDETVSPAFDLLGRRCKVFLGFVNTAWPEDYVTIFRGIITDIEPGAGNVKFSLNSPDNKKRKALFKQAQSDLSSGIGSGDTVLDLDDASEFLLPINAPGSASPDGTFLSYIRLDDEVIGYTGIVGNQLQGLTRGQFGTTAASHSAGASGTSIYQITGNIVDVALKLMLSGFDGPFVEDISVDNFNIVTATDIRANTIIFKERDLTDLNGVALGDFITTTGATNGANNVSDAEITGIEITSDGDTVLTIGSASFVDEEGTSAVMSIRSQYDAWPDGMRMLGDEVDIEQHLFLKNTFLPSFEYDFRLKDTIDNGKDFLEEQVYSPVAAFSVPRKSRASVGFHSGPIPGQNIKTLNSDNVRNPSSLRIRRSTERFFYNEIIYRFDEDILEDRFLGGVVTVNQDSKNRIENKEKDLRIDSQGLTSALSAPNIATSSSNRRIDRYKFGAEFLKVQPFFGDGFTVEVGDIVVFDASGLQITDIKNGSRNFVSRLMEIDDKTLNIRTGDIKLELVDTNFDGQQRFGLISPCSRIKSGISTTQFIIEQSFGSRFGTNEFQKWTGFNRPTVRIRSLDFTTRNETTELIGISGNQLEVFPALSFTPQAGDVMELGDFTSQKNEVTLVFASISDVGGGDFPDGSGTYVIL